MSPSPNHPVTPLTSPNPPVHLDGLNPKVAAEIGAGLLDTQQILERYALTPAQLKHMLRDQNFRKMVREFRQAWNTSTNAKERVRLKAMLAVEEMMVSIVEIVSDPILNPSARIEAYKRLVELADAAPKKDGPEAGEGFTININVPTVAGAQGVSPITIEAQPTNTDSGSDTHDP